MVKHEPKMCGLELDLLELLAAADSPLGAVTLYYQLRDRHNIGQATVGRKLLELDHRGITRRHSFAGRTITDAGRYFLGQLRSACELDNEQAALSQQLSATDLEGLLYVMEARRGVEAYGAYLAAERITTAELEQLGQLIKASRAAVAAGQSGDREDIAFHDLVAKASRNPVLEHTVRLLRGHSTFAPVIASIAANRARMEGVRYVDLPDILAALERRDPAAARDAMSRHIQRMTDELLRHAEAPPTPDVNRADH